MGHVNSQALVHTPFVADLKSNTSTTRLAAIALCEETVGDINSPLFRKFYAARCEEHVRHWYCAPADRGQVPPAPTAEKIYEKFIHEPSLFMGGSSENTTMPIVIVELIKPYPKEVPQTVAEIVSNEDSFEVVGYFGMRQFDRSGLDNHAVVGMFLARRYQNESKSLVILELAAKAFFHFNEQGRLVESWPSYVEVTTLETNLAALRMLQKFIISNQDNIASGDVFIQTKEGGRVYCRASGDAVARVAHSIVKRFQLSAEGVHVLRTGMVETLPKCATHAVLDRLVEQARATWEQANSAIPQQKPNSKNKRVIQAPAPLTAEPSTPTNSDIPSTPQIQSVQKPPQPKPQILIRKRTAVWFVRGGAWVKAQWRTEQHPVLPASNQPSLDRGLLCLESTRRGEIEIFKDGRVPATVRLEQGCFFAEMAGVVTMDAWGQCAPFSVGTEVAQVAPSTYHHDPYATSAINHYQQPQERQPEQQQQGYAHYYPQRQQTQQQGGGFAHHGNASSSTRWW